MVTFERPRPVLGTEDDVILERIAAFVIDFVGFVVIWGVISTVLMLVSDVLGGFAVGFGGLVFLVYFVYFEAEYGQTVGKMVTDIVVVTEDGGHIDYRDSGIRNLLRIIDGLPGVLHLVAIIVILLTDRRQRIGDILADTVVVEARTPPDKL